MKNYMTVVPAPPTFWKTKGGLELVVHVVCTCMYAHIICVGLMITTEKCSDINFEKIEKNTLALILTGNW